MEQTMRDVVDEIQLADDDVGDCVGVDYGSLEKDIQAQRVVALEEKRLEAAIEELLKLETEVRSAADVPRTRRVVVAIVQLCYEARAWKTLNDQILFLSRRQAQPTQAITAMVQQAALYVNDTPDLETRNELIETLNSISAGKGPIKKCWFVDLPLQDTTQSCSRKSVLDDSKQALLPTSCQHHHENARGQSQAEQFEELSLEDFHSPTCGSRPSTPPPQQETKPRDVAPWLSLLPVRRGANVIQKSSRPVRRRLFDPPSPAELEDFLSELEQRDQKRFRDRYNFDPLTEEPLTGRFEWVPVQPRLARALSIDSNLEGKRPNLGPPCRLDLLFPPFGHEQCNIVAVELSGYLSQLCSPIPDITIDTESIRDVMYTPIVSGWTVHPPCRPLFRLLPLGTYFQINISLTWLYLEKRCHCHSLDSFKR